MSSATGAEQRNVEHLRRFINYMNDSGLRVDTDELIAFLHPEIVWAPGMLPHGKRIYKGHDEYRQYVETALAQAEEGNYLSVKEIQAVSEDQVLAVAWVHYAGHGRPAFDGEYAMLARFEDGLIRTLRSFLSRAEAERAAHA